MKRRGCPCVYCGVDMEEVDADNGTAYLHKDAEDCEVMQGLLPECEEMLISKFAYARMVSGDFGLRSTITFDR
ncbi:hypothetical protein LCGC14_1859450 [marine sediment metagenome]|uniref:Uncharacterized protein n=1 Tax=marine sediment metagenome TaxID=412755 RepID=A0A0F9G898_9ZZZZ